MINDIGDLKKLFKLCRSQGIDELKLNGLEIKFGHIPSDQKPQSFEEEQGEPSEEDIMFWSTPQGQESLDKKVGLK